MRIGETQRVIENVPEPIRAPVFPKKEPELIPVPDFIPVREKVPVRVKR